MKKKCKLIAGDIEKIVSLFKKGFSQNYIADEFGVDHSTVYYHLKKRKLLRASHRINFTIKKKKRDNLDEFGEKICTGKSYEEYIDEQEVRRLAKQEECPHQKQLLTLRCKCCGKLIRDEIIKSFNNATASVL